MLFHLCTKKKVFLTFLSAFLIAGAGAEDFRVHKVVPISIKSTDERTTATLGANDALLIELPEDMTYIQGVELTFKVPQVVSEWRDSVAWSVYSGVKPAPVPGKIDYSGSRIKVGTFGSSLSLSMLFPLSKDNPLKKTPYSVYMDDMPDISGGKIFLRLQLAMKGASEEIASAKFSVTAHPIFLNKGKLTVSALSPDGTDVKPYSAFIDGKAVELTAKGILLETGEHTLSLVSEFYRNEVRTINIDQAKTTALQIQFRDITPTVTLSAPKGTSVIFDDEPAQVLEEAFTVTPGEHTVRFVFGDYELVKTMRAENGRSYNVSVQMDAFITEAD